MEGILLGSLSYLGHNYTNKQNNKIKEKIDEFINLCNRRRQSK